MKELTNEELIERAKNGDHEAYEYFYKKNIKFAYHIARRYLSSGYELEDLISCCSVALIKAYQSFDPDKKLLFLSLAGTCMRNEILMYIRRNKKHQGCYSLSHVITTDPNGNESTLEDVLESPDSEVYRNIETQCDSKELHDRIDILSELQQKCLDLRYLQEFTQKEASKKLGISQSYVSRITQGALKKLRVKYKVVIKKEEEEDVNKMKPERLEEIGKIIYAHNDNPRRHLSKVARLLNIPYGRVSYTVDKYKRGHYPSVVPIPFELNFNDEDKKEPEESPVILVEPVSEEITEDDNDLLEDVEELKRVEPERRISVADMQNWSSKDDYEKEEVEPRRISVADLAERGKRDLNQSNPASSFNPTTPYDEHSSPYNPNTTGTPQEDCKSLDGTCVKTVRGQIPIEVAPNTTPIEYPPTTSSPSQVRPVVTHDLIVTYKLDMEGIDTNTLLRIQKTILDLYTTYGGDLSISCERIK